MDNMKYIVTNMAFLCLMKFDNILISLRRLFRREYYYQMSQAALLPLPVSHRGVTKGIRNLSWSHPKHDTLEILFAQNTDTTKKRKKKNLS